MLRKPFAFRQNVVFTDETAKEFCEFFEEMKRQFFKNHIIGARSRDHLFFGVQYDQIFVCKYLLCVQTS